MNIGKNSLKNRKETGRSIIKPPTIRLVVFSCPDEGGNLIISAFGKLSAVFISKFAKAAGLPTQRERAQVAGYGRGHKYSRSNMKDLHLRTLDYSRQRRLTKHPELALPNANQAIIVDEKFTKYLFNPENKKGYAKGVAFSKRLGYNKTNWGELRSEIQNRSVIFPSTFKGDNGYGMVYEQKIILYGKTQKPTNVVVAWIVKDGKPRLTSAYIKEVEKSEH